MAQNLTQQRLEQAFAASGLSQAELARISGIDRGSISLYLSGRYRPKADKLLRLAAALEVSAEWLTGMESTQPEPAIPFPVVTGLDSRGNFILSGEQVLIPRPVLQGEQTEGFFVLAVQGLAMYPRLLEGDRLLVKKTSTLSDGCIAVFAQEGTILVRQVQGSLLQPANPEFPPRPITADLRPLGRAVQLIRAL